VKTFLPNPFFSSVKPPQTANIFIELPTAEIGVEIRRRCVTKPSDHQQILLEKLGLSLPSQLKVIEM